MHAALTNFDRLVMHAYFRETKKNIEQVKIIKSEHKQIAITSYKNCLHNLESLYKSSMCILRCIVYGINIHDCIYVSLSKQNHKFVKLGPRT